MFSGELLQSLLWMLISAALTVVAGYALLPLLRRLHVGQTIRAEGPKKHQTKAGTPTMGGLIFIVGLLVVFALNCGGEPYRWIWLFSLLAFGLIGALDDVFKVVFHRNLGLSAKQKLAAQFLTAALLLIANALLMDRGTIIYLPTLAQGPTAWLDLGWWYYPLVAVFMVGMVNAVNLTDGLDGLAAGVSIPAFIGFILSSAALSGTFGIGEDLSLYAAALAGGCLGFLWFNHYPARVFMGDTGSMSLGGAFVGLMLVSRMEVLALGLGLVYLIEALSVMIQVASFQLTGKRVFRMSPLHHHFEEIGWPETKVTLMFCLASAVCVFLTLLASVI